MRISKNKTKNDFEEKIKEAKYARIYRSLKDILDTIIKVQGKDEIDYAATCSAIKTKARLAIDFVGDLDKDRDKE